MRIRKPILLALPALLLGLSVTEFPAFSRGGSATLIGEGFKPGVCAVEPPAELLALADWPLDSTGCASGKPMVVEARIRSVADILAGQRRGGERVADTRAEPAPVVTAQIVPIERILEASATHVVAVPQAESIDDELARPLLPLAEPSPDSPTGGAIDILVAGHTLKPLRLQHLDRNEHYGDIGASPARKAPSSATATPPALLASAEVDAETLDTLRGGFEAPGGLRMSFGIERVVMLNGVLESTTHLRVDDLGRAAGGAAGPAAALPPGSTVAIIQNGLNNTVSAALPTNAFATVIQNSLDNQKLQTVTTINATVNSAELLRGVRVDQALQEALNRASLLR